MPPFNCLIDLSGVAASAARIGGVDLTGLDVSYSYKY
jgi:hypothetical protein